MARSGQENGISMVTREVNGANIKGLDLKAVVGMVSFENKDFLTITTLNELMSLKTKAEIEIPGIAFNPRTATVIKSIQLKDDNNGVAIVFAEISGPPSFKVLSWIESLAAHMKTTGLVNAFFPAYNTEESSVLVYGRMEKGNVNICWQSVFDADVKNVRIKGKAILFSVNNTLMTRPFFGINEKNWKTAAQALHTYDEKIKFLGRIKNDRIPVTLTNGRTYMAKISFLAISKESDQTNSAGIDEKVSSLVGHIGPGIVAAVDRTGGSLLLVPVGAAA